MPDTERLIDGKGQDKIVEGAKILTNGGLKLGLINVLAAAEHPLLPVTVTLYTAGTVTVSVASVEPSAHKYVVPPVAVRTTEGLAQLNSVEGAVMPAVGSVVFPPMTILAEPVQPLAAVTVTV